MNYDSCELRVMVGISVVVQRITMLRQSSTRHEYFRPSQKEPSLLSPLPPVQKEKKDSNRRKQRELRIDVPENHHDWISTGCEYSR